MQKEFGDEIPEAALKKYYRRYGVEDLDEDENGDSFEYYDYDEDEYGESEHDNRSSSLRSGLRTSVRLIELALATGLILKVGSNAAKQGMLVGQGICDIVIRFLRDRKSLGDLSDIGDIEMISSLAPSVYDVFHGLSQCEQREVDVDDLDDLDDLPPIDPHDPRYARLNIVPAHDGDGDCPICLEDRGYFVDFACQPAVGGDHHACPECFLNLRANANWGGFRCPICRHVEPLY